jgi:hypothetical protein
VTGPPSERHQPAVRRKIEIATNNPFTKFADTWTRSTGHRKLADVLKVIENNADRRNDRNRQLMDATKKRQ